MMYKLIRCFKSDKAVTMVALVVTIIILLILAGVSIRLAFNNGVIDRAKESTEIFDGTSTNEQKELNNLDSEIASQSNYENTLVYKLINGEIKIGDYINYQTPENGSFETKERGDNTSNGFALQSYEVGNNGVKLKWRILGLGNKDGKLTTNVNEATNLLIISGSPVQKKIINDSENDYDKNPYLYMGKAEGYVNAKRILDGISNIYLNENYANNARSINVDDINTILGIEIDNEENIVYEKDDSSKENIDTLRILGKTLNYSENDYSAISYINQKKRAIDNNEQSEKSTGYSYWINNYKNKNIGNTTIGNLLFNQTDFNSKFAKSYWIATTGVQADRNIGFCIGQVYFESVNTGNTVFYSNGNWYVYGLGVYPVISLKPDVTEDDLQIINETDEDWTYKSNIYYKGNMDNYETTGIKGNMF